MIPIDPAAVADQVAALPPPEHPDTPPPAPPPERGTRRYRTIVVGSRKFGSFYVGVPIPDNVPDDDHLPERG